MEKIVKMWKRQLKKQRRKQEYFVWMFWDVGPAAIMLFFWSVVFEKRTQVANYDYYSMITYYLVIIFARNLVLTHPHEGLQREIYSGQINVYLPPYIQS